MSRPLAFAVSAVVAAAPVVAAAAAAPAALSSGSEGFITIPLTRHRVNRTSAGANASARLAGGATTRLTNYADVQYVGIVEVAWPRRSISRCIPRAAPPRSLSVPPARSSFEPCVSDRPPLYTPRSVADRHAAAGAPGVLRHRLQRPVGAGPRLLVLWRAPALPRR